MNRIISYFVFFVVILASLYAVTTGIPYAFSSISAFFQCLYLTTLFNLAVIWILKDNESSSISHGSFIWKIKNDESKRKRALIILMFIQFGGFGYLRAPYGAEYKALMLLAIVFLTFVSATLIYKEPKKKKK